MDFWYARGVAEARAEVERLKAAIRALLPRVTDEDFENLATIAEKVAASKEETAALRAEFVTEEKP